MKILITGGAGFIGSNLAHALRRNTYFKTDELTVVDNLSLGKKKFISSLIDDKKFFFYKTDLLNFHSLLKIFKRHKFDLVWHLSANSDIGYGARFTDWDLKQGTVATYNVLECMRRIGTKKIIFSSSSAVLGEAEKMPTPEQYGPLCPISFYGASKLACEGLLTSFSHNFGFQVWIFRFGNIVGRNSTHGAIYDFIKKLKKNPRSLEVLGDGTQSKPYLSVDDCVEGMVYGFKHSKNKVNLYNLACEGSTSVSKIAKNVVRNVNPGAKIQYTGGKRGWRGDVAKVRLDTKNMKALGWVAKCTSDQAVDKAITDLVH
ncbi:MAG: NAD-dependent epimerase/dehydratase family protein [Candidatus Shapirobacteria bacterium]|jgi:UDP-glucose 4-epimerase